MDYTGTPLDRLTDAEIIAQVRAMKVRERYWTDRAQAARINAWSLLLLSLTAMGGTFASINARDWQLAFGLALVMVLLAWAAGSERQEQRACEKEAGR